MAAVQILAWLLLYPSAWHNYLQRSPANLAGDFCLAELSPSHRFDRALVRLLVVGLGILPVLSVGPLCLLLAASGQFSEAVIWGLLFNTLIATVIAILVHAAAGMAVLSVGGIMYALSFAGADFLAVDLLISSRYGLLFGCTSALVLYVTANVDGERQQPQLRRQVGGAVLGVLASIVVAGLLIGAILVFIVGRQADFLSGQSVRLLMGAFPAALGTLAIWLRTGRWRIGVGFGVVFGGGQLLLFGDIGLEFDRHPAGMQLLRTFFGVSAWNYLLFLFLPFALTRRLAGSWPAAVAGATGGLFTLLTVWAVVSTFPLQINLIVAGGLLLLGLTAGHWISLLTYPLEAAWNTLMLALDRRSPLASRSRLHRHSVFWNEYQRLPLSGLDEHLVLTASRHPQEAQDAIGRVVDSNQRWAAQAAQIELDARRLERCRDVESIARLRYEPKADSLDGPAAAILLMFSKISEDVDAARHQISLYNRRLALAAVADHLNGIVLELTRSNVAYAGRFRAVAEAWRAVLLQRIQELAYEAEARQEIQNPYIVGVPLTGRQELFVGRSDVSSQIEGLLLEHHHPPLLLYGQRRMGKTSLLYQLRWMLPHQILPLVVDLQGPVALARDHAGFLYNLAKGIRRSAAGQNVDIATLSRDHVQADPFTVFDDWLDGMETAIVEQGRSTILLALDEFEALDRAFREGPLAEEAVLGTIRHIVQHRTRFKLLLAGSHSLREFQRWSAYLINAQTVHLSYLEPAAAGQLIEQPIKDFPLAYEPEALRYVLSVTRRHPYLIQLLCSEIVTLKNRQEPARRRLAVQGDVEAAIPETLVRGQQFFADIERNQVSELGRQILHRISLNADGRGMERHTLSTKFGDCPDLPDVLNSLVQRELIEQVDGTFRHQVGLIHRWFTSKSSR